MNVIILCTRGSCKRAAHILPHGAASIVGEWLSLVEHLVRDQGVGGSNPLSPTNISKQFIVLASIPFSGFPQLGSIWVQSTNLPLFAQQRERQTGSNANKPLA